MVPIRFACSSRYRRCGPSTLKWDTAESGRDAVGEVRIWVEGSAGGLLVDGNAEALAQCMMDRRLMLRIDIPRY